MIHVNIVIYKTSLVLQPKGVRFGRPWFWILWNLRPWSPKKVPRNHWQRLQGANHGHGRDSEDGDFFLSASFFPIRWLLLGYSLGLILGVWNFCLLWNADNFFTKAQISTLPVPGTVRRTFPCRWNCHFAQATHSQTKGWDLARTAAATGLPRIYG